MLDWIMAGIICIAGAGCFVALFRLTRKRGENCPRYPYDCPYCCHAVECIDIISLRFRERPTPLSIPGRDTWCMTAVMLRIIRMTESSWIIRSITQSAG